jgi:hypothetical protein
MSWIRKYQGSCHGEERSGSMGEDAMTMHQWATIERAHFELAREEWRWELSLGDSSLRVITNRRG